MRSRLLAALGVVFAFVGAARAAPLRITSTTHPVIFDDFESGVDEWAPWSSESGTVISRDATLPAGGKQCLRVTNAHGGGDFAAIVRRTPFDALQYSWLEFDYRLQPSDDGSPSVKVNFFLRIRGVYHTIFFTGPHDVRADAVVLGSIPNVVADDKWHHAVFPLRGALVRRYPTATALPVDELVIGNWSNEQYLLAGFGGNHAGATYWIDNFWLHGVGEREVRARLEGAGGEDRVRFSLDRNLDGRASGPWRNDAEASLQATASGTWYLHAERQAKPADERLTVPVEVDLDPPRVIKSEPANRSRSGAEQVVLDIHAPSGIDRARLAVRLGDKTLTATDPAVDLDEAAGTLTVDLRRAGLTLANSAPATLSVTLADNLGHAMVHPWRLDWTMDYALDKTPPPAPLLDPGVPTIPVNDFETGIGEWQSYGGQQGALITRSETAPAAGRYCLKLLNPLAGATFGAYVRRSPFSAGRFQVFSFDYRADDQLRVDFVATLSGNRYTDIAFTDKDNDMPRLGRIADVQTDGKWHHAEVNLYAMLRRLMPTGSDFDADQEVRVQSLVVGDWGNWHGNRSDETWYIDNLCFHPVISTREGIRLRWSAAAVSGISAVAATADHAADTIPQQSQAPQNPIILGQGLSGPSWLHCRVRDGAGNWSTTTHLPFIADPRGPSTGPVVPAAGAHAAPEEVRIPLADPESGVDPASVLMTVDGKVYRPGDPGLVYDATAGMLTWLPTETRPAPTVFPDGHDVRCVLERASDFAGNPVTQPVAWDYVMDYREDRVGPPVVVESATHPALQRDDFERSAGGWRAMTDDTTVTLDATTSAGGRQAVRIAATQPNSSLGVVVRDIPFDASQYPLVSFDYRVPSLVRTDFVVVLAGGRMWNIRFTDLERETLERLHGIQTDNRWHHAEFDLFAILRRDPRLRSSEVQRLLMMDRTERTNPASAAYWIDNFTISRPGGSRFEATWHAADATGIAGYSYILDRTPDTEAPTVQATMVRHVAADNLLPGTNYLHVRAKDGAGNWGPTTHFEIVRRAAPAARRER